MDGGCHTGAGAEHLSGARAQGIEHKGQRPLGLGTILLRPHDETADESQHVGGLDVGTDDACTLRAPEHVGRTVAQRISAVGQHRSVLPEGLGKLDAPLPRSAKADRAATINRS